MLEERKVVTVLFADIVGSTGHVGTHSPELVRKTLSRAFARAREVLIAHGGTVEKFVGDAVMAVFGMPRTHDDDADRAVRAAFALRAAFAEHPTQSSLWIELRIGISTGEVVAGTVAAPEFLVTGEAVIAAARLQQAAAPGEILVGTLTRRLTFRSIKYAPARLVDAKGMGSIEGSVAESLSGPVPEHRGGLRGPRGSLVGRNAELRLIADAYERMAGERRAYLLTVYGPAGVGKSRLTDEFVETIAAGRVLRGRCLPYGHGITYWPIQEILRADAGIEASDPAETAHAKIRAAVLRAFGSASGDAEAVAQRIAVLSGIPGAGDALASVQVEGVAQELNWGLRRYLERRAQDAPLTLLIEDIHWAEPALLDLIDHVVDWARAPVFVMCLARPELLDQRVGWGGGKTNAAAVALDTLSDSETDRLIQELISVEDRSGALRSAVIAKAEGNPLYVEELVGMLIDTHQIEPSGDRWVVSTTLKDLVVPPTIHGLIAARLDRLAPPTKHLLQCAAVIGRTFSIDALAALGNRDEIGKSLDDASRRDLVVEVDERDVGGGRTFRFKHVLIRDVAYGTLPLEQRTDLHDRFGRWLEEATAERGELHADLIAYHAEQAFAFALDMESSVAKELAVRAFSRLMSSATNARLRADNHASVVLYDRAVAVGDAAQISPRETAQARGLAAVARSRLEGSASALASLDRAITLQRAFGPDEAFVEALLERAYIARQDSIGAARALAAEAIEAARALGDADVIANAMVRAPWVEWWVGDANALRLGLEAALTHILETGARRHLPTCLAALASVLIEIGDWSRARSLAVDGYDLAASAGSRLAQWEATFSLGRLSCFGGNIAQALRHHREALALAREMAMRRLIARSCEVISDDLFEIQDYAGARASLEEGLSTIDPATMLGVAPELLWRVSRICLAEGDLAAARSNAEAARARLAPGDVYSDTTTGCALALTYEAEGDGRTAERLLIAAVTSISATGYGTLAARVREQLAAVFVRQGRHSDARQLLEVARNHYRDPLAAHARERVDDLLRRCNSAVPG